MRLTLDGLTTGDKLVAGMWVELPKRVDFVGGHVVKVASVLPKLGFPFENHVMLNVDHPEHNRIATTVYANEKLFTYTEGTPHLYAVADKQSFEWFATDNADTTLRDEEIDVKKGDVIELVGYGKFSGQSLEGTVVKKSATQTVVEVTNPEGKVEQKKFNNADGLAAGANGDSGYRLPPTQKAESKAKAPKSDKPKKERVKKADPNPERKCFCGCGGTTGVGSRFIPGHDARAHGLVKKYLRGLLPEEDLKNASEYIRHEVQEQGGYNSQEAPVKKKKAKKAKDAPAEQVETSEAEVEAEAEASADADSGDDAAEKARLREWEAELSREW